MKANAIFIITVIKQKGYYANNKTFYRINIFSGREPFIYRAGDVPASRDDGNDEGPCGRTHVWGDGLGYMHAVSDSERYVAANDVPP